MSVGEHERSTAYPPGFDAGQHWAQSEPDAERTRLRLLLMELARSRAQWIGFVEHISRRRLCAGGTDYFTGRPEGGAGRLAAANW